MRHAMLQELVVNVLAVSGEYRATANQAANDGEHGFKDRQPEERRSEWRLRLWLELFVLREGPGRSTENQ